MYESAGKMYACEYIELKFRKRIKSACILGHLLYINCCTVTDRIHYQA